jgi:hypothetical protein
VLFIQYAVVLDSVHRKCIVGLGFLFSQYYHRFITVFISLSLSYLQMKCEFCGQYYSLTPEQISEKLLS